MRTSLFARNGVTENFKKMCFVEVVEIEVRRGSISRFHDPLGVGSLKKERRKRLKTSSWE